MEVYKGGLKGIHLLAFRAAAKEECFELWTERYGHFLMPSFRHALFIAVAEMPNVAAASYSGSEKSCTERESELNHVAGAAKDAHKQNMMHMSLRG